MKLFVRACSGLIAALLGASALADATVVALTPDQCVAVEASVQRVVYVNGIQNDRQNAQDTRDQIAKVLTASLNHGANPRTFFVEYEWNPYGFNGTNLTQANVLPEDEAELFLQKTDEEMFLWNYRPDQIRSPNNAPVKPDVNAATLLGGYGTNMLPGRTWQQFQDANPGFEITDYQFGDNTVQHRLSYVNAAKPEDIAPSQTVVANLVARTKCPGVASTIVVAHSQGNILASFAYAKLASDSSVDVNKVLRVVNIANTMSFSVNNLNMTHAADTVVSETLRDIATSNHTGTTGMNWWRYTQLCPKSEAYYCPFAIDAPTLQAPPGTRESGAVMNDTCTTSICEHGVVDTYLNETEITTVSDKRGVVYTNDTQTFARFFEDLVYAATSSLDKSNTPVWSIVDEVKFGTGMQGVVSSWTVSNAPAPTPGANGLGIVLYDSNTPAWITSSNQVTVGSTWGKIRLSTRYYVADYSTLPANYTFQIDFANPEAGTDIFGVGNYQPIYYGSVNGYIRDKKYGATVRSSVTVSTLTNRWVTMVATYNTVGMSSVNLRFEGDGGELLGQVTLPGPVRGISGFQPKLRYINANSDTALVLDYFKIEKFE